SNGGKQYHKQNNHDIFNHKNTKNRLCKAFCLDPKLVKRPDNDGCRRACQHTAEEHTVHDAPAEPPPGKITCDRYEDDFNKGRDRSRTAHIHKFLETEFESETEQEKYHTDLCQGLNIGTVHNRREDVQVRAHQETGDDVPKNKRLLDLPENNDDKSRYNQYQC